MNDIKNQMKDYVYIIPARHGSKGLPLKNRKLFDHTIEKFPPKEREKIIVSTDDKEIVKKSKNLNLEIHLRSAENSGDTASMKETLKEVIKDKKIVNKNIILIYLTYPERKFSDIKKIYHYYKENESYTLLCRNELTDHPYLCLESVGDNRGKQLVSHNLYRRQDYPNCFRLSHYVCILSACHLDKLNDNLYNEDTVFYNIENHIDVDTPEDYKRLSASKGCE